MRRFPCVSTCISCRWLVRKSPRPICAWAELTPVRSCTATPSRRRFCRRLPGNFYGGSAFVAGLEVGRGGVEPMIRQLAREIDLLAPAVDDDGRRPDNCEYPWEDDRGVLHVPAEHGFGGLGTLHRHRAGSTLLKIILAAVAELREGGYAAP